jgi:hypothetical protein
MAAVGGPSTRASADDYGFTTVTRRGNKGKQASQAKGQQVAEKPATASQQPQAPAAKAPSTKRQTIVMSAVYGELGQALLKEMNDKIHVQGLLQVPLASATQAEAWHKPVVAAIAAATKADVLGKTQIQVQSYTPQMRNVDRAGRPVPFGYIRMRVSMPGSVGKSLLSCMQAGLGLLQVQSSELGPATFSLSGDESTQLVKITTEQFGLPPAVLAAVMQQGLAGYPAARVFWVGLATSTPQGTVIMHRRKTDGSSLDDLPAPAITGQNQLVALVHGIDPLLSKGLEVRTLCFPAFSSNDAPNKDQPSDGQLSMVLRFVPRTAPAAASPSTARAPVPAPEHATAQASKPPASSAAATPTPPANPNKRTHEQIQAADQQEQHANHADRQTTFADKLKQPPTTSTSAPASTSAAVHGRQTSPPAPHTSATPASAAAGTKGGDTPAPAPHPAPTPTLSDAVAMEGVEAGVVPDTAQKVQGGEALDDEYGAGYKEDGNGMQD